MDNSLQSADKRTKDMDNALQSTEMMSTNLGGPSKDEPSLFDKNLYEKSLQENNSQELAMMSQAGSNRGGTSETQSPPIDAMERGKMQVKIIGEHSFSQKKDNKKGVRVPFPMKKQTIDKIIYPVYTKRGIKYGKKKRAASAEEDQ